MTDPNPIKEQKAPEKLNMINLNQHKLKDGVGIFFSITRLGLKSLSLKHEEHKLVDLALGQLEYLDRFCKQEFPEGAAKPAPAAETKPAPKTLTPNAPAKNQTVPVKPAVEKEIKPETVAQPTPPAAEVKSPPVVEKAETAQTETPPVAEVDQEKKN